MKKLNLWFNFFLPVLTISFLLLLFFCVGFAYLLSGHLLSLNFWVTEAIQLYPKTTDFDATMLYQMASLKPSEW